MHRNGWNQSVIAGLCGLQVVGVPGRRGANPYAFVPGLYPERPGDTTIVRGGLGRNGAMVSMANDFWRKVQIWRLRRHFIDV